MTREEAKANAKIMLAYAKGKLIQCMRKLPFDEVGVWEDCPEPVFEFPSVLYRIKPEGICDEMPKEGNVVYHSTRGALPPLKRRIKRYIDEGAFND